MRGDDATAAASGEEPSAWRRNASSEWAPMAAARDGNEPGMVAVAGAGLFAAAGGLAGINTPSITYVKEVKAVVTKL